MKQFSLFAAVLTVSSLLTSCFFSPCSGCGQKDEKVRDVQVRSLR